MPEDTVSKVLSQLELACLSVYNFSHSKSVKGYRLFFFFKCQDRETHIVNTVVYQIFLCTTLHTENSYIGFRVRKICFSTSFFP